MRCLFVVVATAVSVASSLISQTTYKPTRTESQEKQHVLHMSKTLNLTKLSSEHATELHSQSSMVGRSSVMPTF